MAKALAPARPRLKLLAPAIGAALAVAVLVAGWALRDRLPFTEVAEVYVTGTSGPQQRDIREALQAAAKGTSTLKVDQARLDRAIEPFPTVARVIARAGFPDTLRLEVVQRSPVAAAKVAGRTVPVSAAGLDMSGAKTGRLPAFRAGGPLRDGYLKDRKSLRILQALAPAPAPLRARLELAKSTAKGLVVEVRNGPDLILGGPQDADRKWLAAARVLADPNAAGATYLDLRVPERVGVGGKGPAPDPTPTPGADGSLPQTALPGESGVPTPVPTATPVVPAPTAP